MDGFVVSRPSSTLAPRRRPVRRALGRLAAVGTVLALVAACTERLESGIGCPELCPDQNVAVLDTIIEPIVEGFGTDADSGALDTTLTGFPGLGNEGSLLLAERTLNGVDTLVSYAVIRFDSLPKTFTHNGDSAITALDSVYLQVVVDTVSARRRVPGPVLLEIFDVDTTVANQADTTAATLKPLFRPDRRIGSRVVPPDSLRDSVQLPLSAAALLAKIQVEGVARLRLGLRASAGGAPVQLRIGSTNGGRSPQLNFDPSADTAVHPFRIFPFSLVPAETELTGIRNALADFTVVIDPMRAEPNTVLQVGGLPGRRALLRFHIPSRIADSSTIIRATLLLTQRADPRAVASDTVTVQPIVVLATGRVDVGRAASILDFNNSFGLDTLRLVSGDAGVRTLEMVRVVRAWVSVPQEKLQRALVFRAVREAELPVEALFYSSEAAPELRPRLRLSFVPSVQLGTR